MKKVFKYMTGVEIPKGAIYLSTVVEHVTESIRLVWHYFIVEIKNDK